MPEIANWNGHSFVVSSNLIRSFTDLTIKGSCETTEKNTDGQKYDERKYSDGVEISMTVELSALTGVTNVYSEAMAFFNEANAGASSYFYLGGSKLIPAKLMLTSAQITEIVHMPGQGDVWIQCKVALIFKQSSKVDVSSTNSNGKKPSSGSSSSSGKTGGTSSSTSSGTSGGTSSGGTKPSTQSQRMPVGSGYAKLQAQAAAEQAGKAASQDAKGGSAGLAAQQSAIQSAKAAQSSKTTSTKKLPTTGRAPGGGSGRMSVTAVAIK